MSCKECEKTVESGEVFYIRIGKANVGVLGCREHATILIKGYQKVKELQQKLADKEKDIENLEKGNERMQLLNKELQQKLADKEKELEGWKHNAHNGSVKIRELRSKIETFRKSLIKREEEHQETLIELMAEGLKLCSCIYRARDDEWRKKIEQKQKDCKQAFEGVRKTIKRNEPPMGEKDALEWVDVVEETVDILFKELLDGSSKSEEVGSRAPLNTSSAVKELTLSSNDEKPSVIDRFRFDDKEIAKMSEWAKKEFRGEWLVKLSDLRKMIEEMISERRKAKKQWEKNHNLEHKDLIDEYGCSLRPCIYRTQINVYDNEIQLLIKLKQKIFRAVKKK